MKKQETAFEAFFVFFSLGAPENFVFFSLMFRTKISCVSLQARGWLFKSKDSLITFSELKSHNN